MSVLTVDQKRGILKSAFHSARIEGNPLSFKETKEFLMKELEDSLLPRRLEILHIIRDHKQVSLDFIRRRFLRVSPRLLRYDLKRLQDLNLIKKQGVTKGAVYEPKQEEVR